MEKETSIEITSKMITELTKEMHKEISLFTNAIKDQVNSYVHDPESYEKFKITHEGPLFAEVNTKMFELLKEIKTIRKIKEAILSEEPQIPVHQTSIIPIQSHQQQISVSPYSSNKGIFYVQNSVPSTSNPSPERIDDNGPMVPRHSKSRGEFPTGIQINQNFRSRQNSQRNEVVYHENDNLPRFGRKDTEREQLTPQRKQREDYGFRSNESQNGNGFQIHRSPVRTSNHHRSMESNSPNIIKKPETVYSLPKQRLCKITDFNTISIYNRSGTQLFSEEFCLPVVGQKSGKYDNLLRFSKFKDKFLFLWILTRYVLLTQDWRN